MARADVTQLVTDMSNGLATAAAVSNFYDDIVFEMGLSKDESLTNAALVPATAGTATYTYPPSALRLLGVLYDARYLQPSDVKEAEAFDKQWRTNRGEPNVWLVEQEKRREFTLVPVPRRNGTAVGSRTPFLTDFPEGNITAIFTENRTDVHSYEELTVALEICAREFARDSDHTDLAFADACRKVSQAFKILIGQT